MAVWKSAARMFTYLKVIQCGNGEQEKTTRPKPAKIILKEQKARARWIDQICVLFSQHPTSGRIKINGYIIEKMYRLVVLKYPLTASALKSIADMYRGESRGEDERAYTDELR